MNSFYKLVSVWGSNELNEAVLSQSVTIEAFASHSTSSFTLLVLATSNNELTFVRFNQNHETEKITKPWRYDDPSKKIACMTFSRCGRWLICALTSGNLEVFPTRLAFSTDTIDAIKVQQPLLFSDTDFTSIQCCCRDDCLMLPTCAIWYETKKKRPLLIYSNKGGDILFVDLMIRRLSVSLQAPQSIHNLDVVDDFVQNDRFLLVTGFAGSQWLVPLEQNGRSLRETLGRIVPSELRELNVRGCVSTVYSAGTKCLGLLQKDHFLLFNGINFANPVIDIILPENTWTVNYTDTILFNVSNQTRVAALINQCCATDQNVSTVAKFTCTVGVLPTERFLGFCALPTTPDNILPSCLLITETNVFCAKPETTPKMMLHQFFSPLPDLSNAELVCKAFNLDFATCCFEAVPLLLEEENLECALDLSYLSKAEFYVIAELFIQKGYSKFILPKIESWILKQNTMSETSKTDLTKLALGAYTDLVKSCLGFERKKAEYDFKEFLSHNLWYEPEECLQMLLKSQLHSVALELVKVHNLQEVFLKELLTVDNWPLTDDFLSLITSSSNTSFLLDHRSTLCLHFISRLTNIIEQFPKVWTAKVLYLFDPSRPEVRRFVEQAKDQTFSVDVENLILEVVRFYLTTLIAYLFKNVPPKRQMDVTVLKSEKERSLLENNISSGPHSLFLPNDIPLACGGDHCCLIASDGIFCWGRSKNGCLGNGDVQLDRYSTPLRVEFPIDFVHVVQVSCGAEHTMCLCQNSSVYAWGSNRFGQLGLGDRINRNLPEIVAGFVQSGSMIMRAISGQYHCAAIDAERRVYVWGWNVHGQLGLKIVDDVLAPKRLEISKKNDVYAADVVCGYAHTIILTTTGRIFVCGNNTYGQLGLGDNKKRTKPVELNFFDDTDPVFMISCGFFHNLALTTKRRLFTWGATPQSLKFKALLQKRKQQIQQQQQQTQESELNNKTLPAAVNEGVTSVEGKHLTPSEIDVGNLNVNTIKSLCCGYHHNCLLTTDGQLYSWGKGLEYQLGHGDKKERLTPTLVTAVGDKVISFVSCGADFTVTVDSNGLLNGWGKNDYCQLGFESISETEKHKLSGKVLTIQRANKSERTIQLPQDGRVYVVKPTRIVGLRVSSRRTDVKDNVVYDKLSLMNALREFDGFYKLDDVDELCRVYNAFDVSSFLYLVRGDYVRSAVFLLDAMQVSNQIDSGEFYHVLNFFTNLCVKHELVVEQRARILTVFLKKSDKIKPSFDFNSYFNENFNVWASAIVFLTTAEENEENCCRLLSLSLKMKAIKRCRSKKNETDYNKESAEIEQKKLAELGTTLKDEKNKIVYSFPCGHLIAKKDFNRELTSKLIDSDEFKTQFPRTADCLKNALTDSKPSMCPLCVTAAISKFTSSGKGLLNLL